MSVNIAIIGTGYVGLVTGACLAELGHNVICADVDSKKIEMINKGRLPIYEPGLADLVQRNVAQHRLRFTSDTLFAVTERDAIFIAVGTPSDGYTGGADLSQVYKAADTIADGMNRFTVVITKSTVPVGTNRNVEARIKARLADSDGFAVASNPEFLREGAAISDFLEPDRVIVGADDRRALDVMERIYAPLTSREVPLISTSIETAEMIKYAANAFLATKVSFINEMADLCEAVGADVRDVATGIGLDKRIGSAFLRAGPGWGGSCFPKDTQALIATAKSFNVRSLVVEAASEANSLRKASMLLKVKEACGGEVDQKRIAVLGLTFKGQTDDMRDSPSLSLLPALVAEGASVVGFDPSEPRDAELMLPGIKFARNAVEASADADLLVILTEWNIFKTYDLGQLARSLRRRVMLDLRNLFTEKEALDGGFETYIGIGQKGVK